MDFQVNTRVKEKTTTERQLLKPLAWTWPDYFDGHPPFRHRKQTQNTHQLPQWLQTIAEGNRPEKCWIRLNGACERMLWNLFKQYSV